MEDKTQSRKWLLTINNPKEHGFTHEQIKIILQSVKNISYWCMCDEIGQNNTYHTHLFIYRVNQMRFSQIKKLFPTAHIDYCRGTTQDNRNYIRKEGNYADSLKAETNLKETFEEFGECPEERQGARNDLTELYDMIKDGMSDYEILEVNPNYMKRLETIERTRQIVRFKEFKEKLREDIHVEYRYGASGTGKSRSIYDTYGFKNVYRITDSKYPFDGYSGQDVIVFEEFYSSDWKFKDMLNLLDIYPISLPCRYNNKQACYTKVFINTNVPIEKQYTEIQRESPGSWKAFCRRISCIKKFDADGHITEYHNMDEYLKRDELWVRYDDYKQEKLDFY